MTKKHAKLPSSQRVESKICILPHIVPIDKEYNKIQISYLLRLGRIAQSVTCLTADSCLTADPGVASLIQARSHTFMGLIVK